jgi:hypothetical protein
MIHVLVGRDVGSASDTVALVGTEEFLVGALVAVGQMVEGGRPICNDLSVFTQLFGGRGPVSGCTLHQVGENLTGADVEHLVAAACTEALAALSSARSVLLHVEAGEIGALYPIGVAACAVSDQSPEAEVAFNFCRTDEGKLRVTLLAG